MIALEDIQRAAAELPREIVRTPLLRSEELEAIVGAPVCLKCENLQVTGSYKARAGYTLLRNLPAERRQQGAAISSSGNFAQAFGYMGRLLGIPATVVMPENTSPFKLERARRFGANVILCDPNFDARWETLFALEREGILPLNTFESEDVIRGHGTVGLEILEQHPEADTILVPVSSGGLIAGIATAVKALRPTTRVIGLNPEGSNAVTVSYTCGEATRIPNVDTLCDSLVAQFPGKLPLQHILRYVDEMVTVPDEETKRAVAWLAGNAKLVVEAGGAIAVAALLSGRVKPGGTTVALLSGGNIMPSTLAEYLADSARQRD